MNHLEKNNRDAAKRWRSVIHQRHRPMFEGWFMRLVSTQGECVAVIPGMYRGEQAGYDFVQVVDGTSRSLITECLDAKLGSNQAVQRPASLTIGENSFTPQSCRLNIENSAGVCRGSVSFGDLKPWGGRFPHPAMGWFSWLPRLECYHSVLSFKHGLSGTLEIGDRQIDFDGGCGYMEKTWGPSFPKAWIWSQSHHLQGPVDSFFLSVGIVPIAGMRMKGFTAAVLAGEKLYRWGTWRAERASVKQTGNDLTVSIRGWTEDLFVTWSDIDQVKHRGLHVLIPTPSGLRPGVWEVMHQKVHLTVLGGAKRKERLVEATSDLAALDLAAVQHLVEG